MNTQSDNSHFQVSSQDITLMLNIINTVSNRGAFQPEEFEVVGSFFKKLKSYVVVEEKQEQKEQLELDLQETEQ